MEQLSVFVTIFLGIFLEAVPFLLAGAFLGGVVDVFVNQDTFQRRVPRSPMLAVLFGAGLGMVFPVCECGVVPLTRRLFQKGLPLPAGITFLLAAPVINPIVIFSTWSAFGWGTVLILRLVLTFIVAITVGLVFTFATRDEILRADSLPVQAPHDEHAHSLAEKLLQVLTVSGLDFMDMVRFLILGSAIAAGMQTLVPQTALLAIGSSPLLSVVAMMLLAFVLSVCSTVDAFLALAFVNTFTLGAIVAFLTFGPMVDIKSTLLYLRVFKPRAVLYLVLLPFMMILVAGWLLNLYGGYLP
jgi:uncharacterized membrane protein YraQ (UPF0718 family)